MSLEGVLSHLDGHGAGCSEEPSRKPGDVGSSLILRAMTTQHLSFVD